MTFKIWLIRSLLDQPRRRRLPRLHRVHFVAARIDRRRIAQGDADQMEPARRLAASGDVDLAVIDAEIIFALLFADAEGGGLLRLHRGGGVDKPAGIDDGAGTSAAIGITGIGDAFRDVMRRVDGDVATGRQISEESRRHPWRCCRSLECRAS